MIPYIVILCLSFLLSGLEYLRLRAKEKIWFFLGLVCILILFASLKPPHVDLDYENYATAYGYMKYLPWSHLFSAYSTYNMEFGYIFLNKLFSSIGFSFSGFLFFYELALGIVSARLMYKYSPYPLTTLCLYVSLFYFIRDLTQIRFAFSAILLLSGFFNLAEDKKWGGWICLICAGLLHNSAWIGLLIPLSYHFFYNRWLYLIFPPLGYIISLFHPIDLLLRFVGLPEQITRYLADPTAAASGFMIYPFAYMLMIFGVFHYPKMKELFGAKFEYLFISLAFGVFLGLMFLNFPIMQRISGALITAVVFYIAFIIKMLYEKKWYGYRDLFALSMLVVFLYYGFKLILIAHILKPYF